MWIISKQIPDNYSCINTFVTFLSMIPTFTSKLTNSMKSIAGLVNTVFTAGVQTVLSIGLYANWVKKYFVYGFRHTI